jgi:hypothetical protein
MSVSPLSDATTQGVQGVAREHVVRVVDTARRARTGGTPQISPFRLRVFQTSSSKSRLISITRRFFFPPRDPKRGSVPSRRVLVRSHRYVSLEHPTPLLRIPS